MLRLANSFLEKLLPFVAAYNADLDEDSPAVDLATMKAADLKTVLMSSPAEKVAELLVDDETYAQFVAVLLPNKADVLAELFGRAIEALHRRWSTDDLPAELDPADRQLVARLLEFATLPSFPLLNVTGHYLFAGELCAKFAAFYRSRGEDENAEASQEASEKLLAKYASSHLVQIVKRQVISQLSSSLADIPDAQVDDDPATLGASVILREPRNFYEHAFRALWLMVFDPSLTTINDDDYQAHLVFDHERFMALITGEWLPGVPDPESPQQTICCLLLAKVTEIIELAWLLGTVDELAKVKAILTLVKEKIAELEAIIAGIAPELFPVESLRDIRDIFGGLRSAIVEEIAAHLDPDVEVDEVYLAELRAREELDEPFTEAFRGDEYGDDYVDKRPLVEGVLVTHAAVEPGGSSRLFVAAVGDERERVKTELLTRFPVEEGDSLAAKLELIKARVPFAEFEALFGRDQAAAIFAEMMAESDFEFPLNYQQTRRMLELYEALQASIVVLNDPQRETTAIAAFQRVMQIAAELSEVLNTAEAERIAAAALAADAEDEDVDEEDADVDAIIADALAPAAAAAGAAEDGVEASTAEQEVDRLLVSLLPAEEELAELFVSDLAPMRMVLKVVARCEAITKTAPEADVTATFAIAEGAYKPLVTTWHSTRTKPEERVRALYELMQVTKQLMKFDKTTVARWFNEAQSDAGVTFSAEHLSFDDYLLLTMLVDEYKSEMTALSEFFHMQVYAFYEQTNMEYQAFTKTWLKEPHGKVSRSGHPNYKSLMDAATDGSRLTEMFGLTEAAWQALIQGDITTNIQGVFDFLKHKTLSKGFFTLFDKFIDYCLGRDVFDFSAAKLSIAILNQLKLALTDEAFLRHLDPECNEENVRRITAEWKTRIAAQQALVIASVTELLESDVELSPEQLDQLVALTAAYPELNTLCVGRRADVGVAAMVAAAEEADEDPDADEDPEEVVAEREVYAKEKIKAEFEVEFNTAGVEAWKVAMVGAGSVRDKDGNIVAGHKIYEVAYQKHFDALLKLAELLTVEANPALLASLGVSEEGLRILLLTSLARLRDVLSTMLVPADADKDDSFAAARKPDAAYCVILLAMGARVFPDELAQQVVKELKKQSTDKVKQALLYLARMLGEGRFVGTPEFIIQQGFVFLNEIDDLVTFARKLTVGVMPRHFAAFVAQVIAHPQAAELVTKLLENRAALGLTQPQIRRLISIVEERLSGSPKEYADFIAGLPVADEAVCAVVLAKVKVTVDPSRVAKVVVGKVPAAQQPAFEVLIVEPAAKPEITGDADRRALTESFSAKVLHSLGSLTSGEAPVFAEDNPAITAIKTALTDLNARHINWPTAKSRIADAIRDLRRLLIAEVDEDKKVKAGQIFAGLDSLIEYVNQLRIVINFFADNYADFMRVRMATGEVSSEQVIALLDSLYQRADLRPAEEAFIFAERTQFLGDLANAIAQGVVKLDDTLADKLMEVINQGGLTVGQLISLLQADKDCLLAERLVGYLRDNFARLNPTGRQMAELVSVLTANPNPVAQTLVNNILSGGSVRSAGVFAAVAWDSSWTPLRLRLREADDLARLMTASYAMIKACLTTGAALHITAATRAKLIADFNKLLAKKEKTYADYRLIARVAGSYSKSRGQARPSEAAALNMSLLGSEYEAAKAKMNSDAAEDSPSGRVKLAGKFMLDLYFDGKELDVRHLDFTPLQIRAMLLALVDYPISPEQKAKCYHELFKVLASQKVGGFSSELRIASRGLAQFVAGEAFNPTSPDDSAFTKLFYLAKLTQHATPELAELISAEVVKNARLAAAFSGDVTARFELTSGLINLFMNNPALFNQLLFLEPIYRFVVLSENSALQQTLNSEINADLPVAIRERVACDEALSAEFAVRRVVEPDEELVASRSSLLWFSLSHASIAAAAVAGDDRHKVTTLAEGLHYLQASSTYRGQREADTFLRGETEALRQGVKEIWRVMAHNLTWADSGEMLFPEPAFFAGGAGETLEQALLNRARFKAQVLAELPDEHRPAASKVLDILLQFGHGNGYDAGVGAALNSKSQQVSMLVSEAEEVSHQLTSVAAGHLSDAVSLRGLKLRDPRVEDKSRAIAEFEMHAQVGLSADGVECQGVQIAASSMQGLFFVLNANDCLTIEALVTHAETIVAQYVSMPDANVAAAGRLLESLRTDAEELPGELAPANTADQVANRLFFEIQSLQQAGRLLRLLNSLDKGCVQQFLANGVQGVFNHLCRQGIVLTQQQADFLIGFLSESDRKGQAAQVIGRYLLLHNLSQRNLQHRMVHLGIAAERKRMRSASVADLAEMGGDPEGSVDLDGTLVAGASEDVDPRAMRHSASDSMLSLATAVGSDEDARLSRLLSEEALVELFAGRPMPTSMDELKEDLFDRADDGEALNCLVDWLHEDPQRVRTYADLLHSLLTSAPADQIDGKRGEVAASVVGVARSTPGIQVKDIVSGARSLPLDDRLSDAEVAAWRTFIAECVRQLGRDAVPPKQKALLVAVLVNVRTYLLGAYTAVEASDTFGLDVELFVPAKARSRAGSGGLYGGHFRRDSGSTSDLPGLLDGAAAAAGTRVLAVKA